jgi:hypothetical protein
MTKSTMRVAVLVGVVASLTGCNGGGSSEAQGGCSLATLEGRYVFAYDGFNVSGPAAANRLPFAAAGHETYSGDGEVEGFTTTNANGVVSGGAYSGTYTLAADCTGTTTLTDEFGVTTHYAIVAQQNGRVVGYVQTDANVVTAGYESRRSGAQGRCTPATLRGTYIYANDGFMTGGGASTQRSPFAQAGADVYDGDGGMSGSVTASDNGNVIQISYDGTYVLDDNCSGTITSAGAGQSPFHFAIYADSSGEQFAFVRIDANVVNAGYESRR